MNKLKTIQQRMGLTNVRLADLCCVTERTIERWRAETRETPGVIYKYLALLIDISRKPTTQLTLTVIKHETSIDQFSMLRDEYGGIDSVFVPKEEIEIFPPGRNAVIYDLFTEIYHKLKDIEGVLFC